MTRALPQPGNDPSQLPEIRDWIVRNLQVGEPLRFALDYTTNTFVARGEPAPTIPSLELEGIKTAKLFWVPAAEQEIIVNASQNFPDELVLSEDDIPYPSGFAVFENEFTGLDSETGETMPSTIKALRWSPVNVMGEMDVKVGACMSMSAWTFVTREEPRWIPLGRIDWMFGQRWDQYFDGYSTDVSSNFFKCMVEDRARFMALWALMNTQDVMVYVPTRHEARRDARIAPPSTDRTIHVVKWDPKRYEHETTGLTGRKVHVRYHVDGFWARRACGPRKTLRKWTYIPPHWRGPEDAPVKGETITVNKVVSS